MFSDPEVQIRGDLVDFMEARENLTRRLSGGSLEPSDVASFNKAAEWGVHRIHDGLTSAAIQGSEHFKDHILSRVVDDHPDGFDQRFGLECGLPQSNHVAGEPGGKF